MTAFTFGSFLTTLLAFQSQRQITSLSASSPTPISTTNANVNANVNVNANANNDIPEAPVRIKIASSVAKSERRHNERMSSVFARDTCANCRRPVSICLCDALPSSKINLDTKLLILQHPTEFKRKTISTVPLIPLVLEQVQIKVGYQFEDNWDQLDWIKEALEQRTKPLLLFPGPDAIDLTDLIQMQTQMQGNDDNNRSNHINNDDMINHINDENSNHKNDNNSQLLILLDGTWSQAKRMARESPSLVKMCQKVQFTSPGNSIYDQIRKEPEDHFMSTLECCVTALTHLQPDCKSTQQACGYLMDALSGLVHQQLRIREGPDPNPRFVDPKTKFQEKNGERRLEIEQELFRTQTLFPISPPSKTTGKAQTYHENKGPKYIRRLADGSTLRPLRHSDIPTINALFARGNSPKSLNQITRQIHATNNPANFGIMRGHELCAFIMQYENGVLGMLHVEEPHRQKGYGAELVQMATQVLEEQGKECVAYIVDGNAISERVFSKCGWRKADPNVKKGTGRRRAPRKWIKDNLPSQ